MSFPLGSALRVLLIIFTISNLSLYISGLHSRLTNKLDLPCFTLPTIKSSDGGCGKCGCISANLSSGSGSLTLNTLGGAFSIYKYNIYFFYILNNINEP